MSDRLAEILESRRARVEQARRAGLDETLRLEAETLAAAVRPLRFEERLRTSKVPLIVTSMSGFRSYRLREVSMLGLGALTTKLVVTELLASLVSFAVAFESTVTLMV